MENTFKAPWGTLLKVITLLALLILLGIFITGILGLTPVMHVKLDEYSWVWYLFMLGAPAATILGTLFFIVRGYGLLDGKLYIYRLGWAKSIELLGIKSVEFDPDAVKGSIRLFGNGGLFAFSGIYRNKKLGNFRIYATDFKKCVVIKTEEKTYVITPDNPEIFLERIKQLCNL